MPSTQAVAASFYQTAFKKSAFKKTVIRNTISKAESSILLSLWMQRHSTKIKAVACGWTSRGAQPLHLQDVRARHPSVLKCSVQNALCKTFSKLATFAGYKNVNQSNF